jgi:isopentenyl-diphosphate delta-isomerase
MKKKAGLTSNRKLDHIRICLEKNVESSYTGFEDIQFIHNALPEVDLDAIKMESEFLGHKFSAPIMVASMTGGHPETTRINRNIALAIQNLGLGMGVGSQRAAIEDSSQKESFTVVREHAPDAFIYANVGMPQVREFGAEFVEKAVGMIDADAVAIHLNFLQEAIQPEGDVESSGCISTIEKVVGILDVPVIVKETGSGISRETAMILQEIGVSAIDVGGKGGTSWAGVEVFRSPENSIQKELGVQFWDWGIPTALTVIESSEFLPTIATGGIRTGIDVAKSIAIGADMAGVALPVLKAAATDHKAVERVLNTFILGLKTVMFLTGCRELIQLRNVSLLVSGMLKDFLEERGVDIKKFVRGR